MSAPWYTGSGDKGKTKVPSVGEVWKDDELIEALGNLDELNSLLGVVSSLFPDITTIMEDLQNDIFEISSEIAGFNMNFNKDKISKLESLIQIYGNQIETLRNFILPGGHLASSFLHLARATSRRAERSLVKLYKSSLSKDVHVTYLNRLSSLLFVMGLWVNKKTGNPNIIWKGKANQR
ncbi:cob(I)yrinic acid a,c-diamide adenosyltransferase [Metallosphaera tengchongensis]|uniref:Cob(I)yrinic acid a,c-diamide adenosyltransferase n=1 Tax=Metallosphaera tengchongensis TaxID=1532350 RepID=A0A6N0NT26_9CREN|nr:cob(I)yrinic acid a,c-diamide adenosyltransferase [Metallosphaera tengchongensis]QKQ99256.1 cob(I)yrinic acid a,c-diamide adenosyltransferase [Metallosphaera tengchongensis]